MKARPAENKADIPTFGIKLKRCEAWLILINADPDAMASALALRRILRRRVDRVDIAKVNQLKRPDNLAMIHLLRIKMLDLTPELPAQYTHLALVDSQPHHHPDFVPLKFSAVIDHHPKLPEHPVKATYVDVRPGLGATSTILTEYLRKLKIRPGKLLATALLYGIKTDTQSFERQFKDADIRAFSYLSRFHNRLLLRKITSSEFNRSWLRYFSQAFQGLEFIGRSGLYLDMGEVESPDILVILADFFTRVHGLSWNMVSGTYSDTVIVVLRGDGLRLDVGEQARKLFGDMGSAGGHKAMARAEFPLYKLAGQPPKDFILSRIASK